MHLSDPKHDVLVIILKSSDIVFSFYLMNTQTNLLRIGTQQYSPYVYIADFKQNVHLKY